MSWKPIETYDRLKRPPKHCLFLFAESSMRPSNPTSAYVLPQTVQLTRYMGSRVCIAWCKYPDPKEFKHEVRDQDKGE
ncbi:MAG: hypothetical protein LPL29_07650 [Alphaproteobacteria bacterium]|nr:hypothetical protein [Alphaproteobacteria bacterium]